MAFSKRYCFGVSIYRNILDSHSALPHEDRWIKAGT